MNNISPHLTSHISAMLQKGRIYEAIQSLKPHVSGPAMSDMLREAETIYNQMLRFLSSVSPDASRDRILGSVRERIYIVTDSIVREQQSRTSSGYYYSKLRTLRLHPELSIKSALTDMCSHMEIISLADLAGDYDKDLHWKFEQTLETLFDLLMVNHVISRPDAEMIEKFLKGVDSDDDAGIFAVLTLISALLISSLQFYDSVKLRILAELYACSLHPAVSARALVALALITITHPDRVGADDNVRAVCEACAEKEGFGREMRAFVAAMLRTRDTDRVNRKMKEEIIPDIMKLRPELEKRMRNIDPDDLVSEESPAWMEMIEKSGIEDKLREFSEMQMQGADVFMGAFAGMKSFPLFNSFPAWFMPFSISHSLIKEIEQKLPARMLEIISVMPVLCDSDKYSLVFSMSRVPLNKMGIVSAQMQAQYEAFDSEMHSALKSSLQDSVEREISLYLKDLFRFFRLSAKREGFMDPFAKPLAIPSSPLFDAFDSDDELQRLMADFYFKYGYWEEASRIYNVLASSPDVDFTDVQKQGYCLEMLGEMQRALNAYQCAELLSEPDKWLLKRIAGCLRATGDYAGAAEYYARALDMDPDNVRLELLRGHSLLEAGRVSEALKCYYKVDYLAPDSRRAMRPVAWCEFLLGNYAKSLERYMKIIAEPDVTASDILNCGHVYLAMGNLPEAIATYKKVLQFKSPEEFRTMLSADIQTLEHVGVSIKDLNLIADATIME